MKQMALEVRQLGPRQRGRILRHFLALSEFDRNLRFGGAQNEAALGLQVAQIDFARDALFGLSRPHGQLLALAHLARCRESGQHAELGLSVLARMRGRGLGFQLLQHALQWCRQHGFTRLYLHCLATNQSMLHLAHKTGMQVQTSQGEASAWLQIDP